MLKALPFRNRRHLMSRICAVILFIIFCLIARRLYYNAVLSSDSSSKRIIVVNLRAINQSIPEFIAEEHHARPRKVESKVQAQQVSEPVVVEDMKSLDSSTEIESPIKIITPSEKEEDEKDEKEDKEEKTESPGYYVFEALIKADEEKIIPGLGDFGEPVKVVPFTSDDEVERCMKKEAFNRVLSDKISLTRKVPDARHPLCNTKTYPENLPSATIIIIFINEAWSSLLRTVHSALSRSPEKLLKEIILVDDFSNREDLKDKLDYYLRTRLPDKVRLLRLPKRNGLIKARLAGAKVATGDVLVFLDSHCECGIDWLQPLLQRIKDKKNAVVCPVIDVIDDRTMGYLFNQDRQFQIGGFTWSGHFTWIPVPEAEVKRRESEISPTRSPTMAGGLFAIDRNYFWELGSYDPEMEVWGGENLEMSFRIWQCGGSLEVIPCSRVGHIFRSFHPYTFPGRKDTHGINTARMAEVWMDDYKRLFYLHRPDLKRVRIGDISMRKELREKLQCKDFRWFLKNVIPQKFVLDENVIAYGRIKSKVRHFCFDNLNYAEDVAHDLGIYNCHEKLFSSQFFSLTNKGELRREELCAEVTLRFLKIAGLANGARGNVTLVKCDGSKRQIWTYENEIIRNDETGFCIHSYGVTPESLLTVAPCKEHDVYFRWIWEYIKSPNGDLYHKNDLFR